MYDLETERAADEIRRLDARRVLVQLPDGLRPGGLTLARELRELTGATVILSGDSCYGACDLALTQADAVGADLIIHYGHSPMLQAPGTPVLYIEARIGFDAETLTWLVKHPQWDPRIRLSSPAQRDMKRREILRDSELDHKFVRALRKIDPNAAVSRKSGSWSTYHCDSALVQRDGHSYIAVAPCDKLCSGSRRHKPAFA